MSDNENRNGSDPHPPAPRSNLLLFRPASKIVTAMARLQAAKLSGTARTDTSTRTNRAVNAARPNGTTAPKVLLLDSVGAVVRSTRKKST